jgi:hypothetical protein
MEQTAWNNYKGQSKKDIQKNHQRIKDIVSKSGGDLEKRKRLAESQSKKITDEYKAINRAITAKEMGYEDIFDIFFRRAYELGNVSKKEFRKYKLEKLNLDLEDE